MAVPMVSSPSLLAESERYRQRNMIHSHVFRHGTNLFGDGQRLCRRRVINSVKQEQKSIPYYVGEEVTHEGATDTNSSPFSGYQENRISDDMGYAKWVAERTKLRSDLDGFGLSKSWLKSKVRTLLERDVMQSVSEVNQYESLDDDVPNESDSSFNDDIFDSCPSSISDTKYCTKKDRSKRKIVISGFTKEKKKILYGTSAFGTCYSNKEERRKERKVIDGIHQQLANEYRKKEAEQVSKLLSLCSNKRIAMNDNFVEKALLSPIVKSREVCLSQLPAPRKLQANLMPESLGDAEHFIKCKKKPHNNAEIMKLPTGACSVKARVDCWFPQRLYRKKQCPAFTSVTISSFWPGSRDNMLYLDDCPSTEMTPSRCSIFHIIHRDCRSFPISSWPENSNGYVQFGIL